MKYRIKKENSLSESELTGVDFELTGLVETDTNRQVYVNDIVRFDGQFRHVIWWNATKRSSGKPSETILSGFAIYKVVSGGEMSYAKLELLKSDHTFFQKPNNVYTARTVYPALYDWKTGYKVSIIGNTHFDDINELIKEQKL